MRRRSSTHRARAWGYRKLVAALTGAALMALVLLGGLGLSVYYTLRADTAPTPNGDLGTAAADPRDALAARPMPTAPADAAQPGPLTTRSFGSLSLPNGDRLGAAGVATGFPATAAGALAQLIAIDQAALQSASVPGAQAVITAWASPGGPTSQSWSGVKAIAGLLSSADLPASGSPSLIISAIPEMGLVKGTVGPRFVVACVDFVVTATATTTAKIAAADCQRLVWTTGRGTSRAARLGRWIIGPGIEPAQPPSVWPGTETAHDAGYLRLEYEAER